MLFSYNWLKEYITNMPAPKELADTLTMSGAEVESVAEAGGNVSGVITAQVVSCAPHPNADRLQLCEVRSDKETFSIVCGAKNMKPGDKVALATIGAELPGNFKIKKSKIRGVESQGMMCSEVELGLKDTSEGLLILPEDTPLGLDLNEVLGLKDSMLEVGITPNRADLLSIKGLAREISAVTGAAFKEKETSVEEGDKPVDDLITVSIETDAPCGRYCARVIEGVVIGPSPDGIKRRLEAHGIRSINNVVDVTNLVLLETGQPLHAFDLDKITGRTIDVRLAAENEEIETIDNKVRKLDTQMLVIADEAGPVALAGVMGGKGSEVTEITKNILLESAWFEPASVRRTSKKLGLSSDSSYRFERGVDADGVIKALDMAVSLIKKLAGGSIAKGIVEVYPEKISPSPIEFRVKRAQALLGIDITEAQVLDIFKRLGIETNIAGDGVITALPPTYRGDLKIETDLVEEAARIYGYNNIPTVMPLARLIIGEPGKHTNIKKKVKEILVNDGFFEILNYSFISRDAFGLTGPEGKSGVTILNPLSEEQVVMRDSLIPTLLETLKRNLLKKNEEVRIYEFAPAFIHTGGKLPDEKWMISGLMYGLRWNESWNQPKDGLDFFDVKGVVERIFEGLGIKFDVEPLEAPTLFHPGKSAAIVINGKKIGSFGETHPDIKPQFDLKRPAYIFEIEADALIGLSAERKYSALPKFPESARDIAFIVDENIPYKKIINSIEQLDTKIIERVELFDVYYGGNIPSGKRSMALRVTYRSMDKTLTAQEVDEMHAKVTSELTGRYSAEVRGEAK
ncbi:MAG: phenylalanine--tRNA ligase subunit beta [Deltaproteobacteria bacterium]|nr:phenylalanine--tRNA ligase subunit beta [Deltaproteobacteria bacterium]